MERVSVYLLFGHVSVYLLYDGSGISSSSSSYHMYLCISSLCDRQSRNVREVMEVEVKYNISISQLIIFTPQSLDVLDKIG